MKIGTILFVYHRSIHTKKVLEALKENSVLPQKLYIFQDGIKSSTNLSEWEKVNGIIRGVNWCNTEIQVSDKNKGLAKSIVSGINYVLQECEAVIVLEDDCVPHKEYMNFMVSALETYQKQQKVYSVSGYAWDVNLQQKEEDAYFNGRICSYGWGTWKDRWCQYEEDYRIVTKLKNDLELGKKLQVWGKDLEEILVGNIQGKCDSWAAFWALKVIEKGGYCLSPYKQFIHNVGFDGSGVHSSKLQENDKEWEDKEKKYFCFPEEIKSTEECEREFEFLFAGEHIEKKLRAYQKLLVQWIQRKQAGTQLQLPIERDSRIAVWGKGEIFDCLLNELSDSLKVKFIIESRPSLKTYRDIPIISINELPESIKNVVVLPFFDLRIIGNKVKKIRPDVHLWGIDELFN